MANLSDLKHVHIIGIGGAGMSAIARVLHGLGIAVSGSDRRISPITKALIAEGMTVYQGHATENITGADLVLASSAVPDDNVEWGVAKETGIATQRRPEFLTTLTESYKVIGVAGAHGKTTVTGMLALLLQQAGLDPTYIVGGVMKNLGTNARTGKGPYFVIEADEYRNTFHALYPTIAVVTNVEFDHPDCFPSARHVRLAFGDFVDNIRPGGTLAACFDDRVAHAVGVSYHANGGHLMLYGANDGTGLAWQAVDIHANAVGGVTFTAMKRDVNMGQVVLQVPGAYNAVNALAVLCVAETLEIDWETTQKALEAFEGTARRFELLGEVNGVTVIDDYAHHPTQIRGVLEAARQRFGNRRLIAVWEPHTFSRIRALYEDFMQAFSAADAVMLMPIYAAREVNDGTLTALDLAKTVDHVDVKAAETLDEAVQRLAGDVQSGDVVLFMGAGNEYIAGQRLLEALAK